MTTNEAIQAVLEGPALLCLGPITRAAAKRGARRLQRSANSLAKPKRHRVAGIEVMPEDAEAEATAVAAKHRKLVAISKAVEHLVETTTDETFPRAARNLLGALVREGADEDLRVLKPLMHAGCGQDLRETIAALEMTGESQAFTCPKCGRVGHASPPEATA